MIKVSVIVPVYNVERYLSRCIESVINQTYDNIELILVDDGSTDTSGQLCDSYGSKDNRIIVIHKNNGGVSSARNVALKAVTGDYIMFLDGDDALDLNTIESCVDNTEGACWDVVLFGFHMYMESNEAEVFQNDVKYSAEVIESKEQMTDRFSEYYRKGYFNFITDKIIRRSLILDHSIEFKSKFNIGGEDGMFILDLAPYISNLKVTSEAYYQYYRRSGESVTQLFKAEKYDRYYDRIVRIYDFMNQEDCIDKKYLVELFGTYFLWAYESTFHPSCKLSFFERFRYNRKTFKKDDIFSDQEKYQKQAVYDFSAFAEYSKSSLVALKLFYQRHFLILSIWNMLTVLKSR